MTSTLQLLRYSPTCSGGFRDSCFRICHQTLRFEQRQPTTADFGPYQARISTASGECFCDQYRVHEATVKITSTAAEAIGSTSGGVPFSQVQMTRTASDTVTILWVSSNSGPFTEGESCTATYTGTAGPEVLGTSTASFANWWAILVGLLILLLILGAVVLYCGFFARASSSRPSAAAGRTLNRRTTGGGAAVASAGTVGAGKGYVSEGGITESPAPATVISPMRSSPAAPSAAIASASYEIPVATAVPVSSTSSGTQSPADADVYNDRANHRQVAIV